MYPSPSLTRRREMDGQPDPAALAEVAWHSASRGPFSHSRPRTTDSRISNSGLPVFSNNPSPTPEQIEQLEPPLNRAPIAFEEAHSEAACFPTAVAFDVVARLVGSAAPVVVAAVPAHARAAAAEVSADHLGTGPMPNPPSLHRDLPAGRK